MRDVRARPLEETISAGAGSTHAPRHTDRRRGNHPRGCREHTHQLGKSSGGTGPSPRVRGAQRHAHLPRRHTGTIPACGEHHLDHLVGVDDPGPSARVRGALTGLVLTQRLRGTIPAGAGSTASCCCATTTARDHPRGCGEHSTPRTRSGASSGPSPRARGAPGVRRFRRRRGGTIPAGAGSTHARSAPNSTPGDHPRGCGGHPRARSASSTCRGPFPRVRGARRIRTQHVRRAGTIPAGAGSTWRPHCAAGSCRDHPRGCGEHQGIPAIATRMGGPSPRVRGAHRPGRDDPSRAGTIPAGAGSTRRLLCRRSSCWDHPRGCGEHTALLGGPVSIQGPSPRVRGAPGGGEGRRFRHGTIPAGAGSTADCRDPSARRWDHPRGCGEHLEEEKAAASGTGLSPRVRGALRIAGILQPGGGTIPAGAGSTAWA